MPLEILDTLKVKTINSGITNIKITIGKKSYLYKLLVNAKFQCKVIPQMFDYLLNIILCFYNMKFKFLNIINKTHCN